MSWAIKNKTTKLFLLENKEFGEAEKAMKFSSKGIAKTFIQLLKQKNCYPVNLNASSKFRNVTDSYDGRSYQSGLERNYAADLDVKKRAKLIKDWQPQHAWQIYVNGKKICQYTIDFRIVNNDGVIDYVETKGAEDYAFSLRWKLVQALFEELIEGERARLYKNSQLVKQVLG